MWFFTPHLIAITPVIALGTAVAIGLHMCHLWKQRRHISAVVYSLMLLYWVLLLFQMMLS